MIGEFETAWIVRRMGFSASQFQTISANATVDLDDPYLPPNQVAQGSASLSFLQSVTL
jgi:hypothetical protein